MFDLSIKSQNIIRTDESKESQKTYLHKSTDSVDTFESSSSKKKTQPNQSGKFNTFINNLLGQKADCTDVKDVADDVSASLKRAEDSLNSATEKTKKISSNLNLAKGILDEASKMFDNSYISQQELKKFSQLYETISKISNDSLSYLDEAQVAFSQVKESAQQSAKSSDSKKQSENSVSSYSDIVQSKASVIDEALTLSETELKKMCKLFADVDKEVSGFDYDKVDYTDDGIIGYDSSAATSIDECRTSIYMKRGFADKDLQVKKLDVPDGVTPQLPETSKYASLGIPRQNNRDGKFVYLCENLKDAADGNGLRGKTPLAGKTKVLNWRLGKIKEAGIKRIIDLRSKGECSQQARKVLSDLGLEYINFPVEDCNWTAKSLDSITEFINAVNEGDYYVGCANGEGRTDIAVAINYLFNPNAKNVPDFYFGSFSTTRVSVKENVNQIFNLINENKDILEDWGWFSYEDFCSELNTRFANVLNQFSN